MEREFPVSALTTAQLVTLLSNLGITRAGLDSVQDKEVTGSMLSEFCEEDIKDVFTEFKDRFRIRKLLRDIAEKSPVRLKSVSSNSHHPDDSSNADEWPGIGNNSTLHQVSAKAETAPSPLCLSSSDHRFHGQTNISRDNKKVMKTSCHPLYTGFEEPDGDIKSEREESTVVKRQRVEDMLSVPQIPAAHSSSYNVLQSTSRQGSNQHSVVDSFVSPPSVSAFFNRTEFLPSYVKAHPRMVGNFSHGQDQRKLGSFGSSSEEQALCLKKSPPRTASPPRTRTDSASPATQPSSTTPDYLHSLDTTRLDFTSIMSMGHLAAKYSAQEILSKKGQRSRPNSAQKLGSILIRNAAQQADLWSSPPHLRSISQPQKQEFLNSVYQVAPHIRECEHLLWQRLSETLQNRRKYLLDKKLGKRGLASSSQSSGSSSSSQQDFPDISQWQVTSVQSHLSSLGEEMQSDVNILSEVATSQDYTDTKHIKTEPVT